MNVKNAEKKEKNLMELTVEISPEEFDEAVNAVYKKNRSMISVPGFRKGKAPRRIIENMYGTSVFYEDAVETLYPQALEFAIENENLNVVGRPNVNDINIGDDKVVTITYSVSLYPEITIGEYKGLSAPKTAVKVLKKEIDEDLENARKRNARIETVERAAKDGDTAVIDFEGFVDGKAFDGGKGEGFNLVLGSGQFIPGFEEQVVGMSAGDEKEINVKFPDGYTPELAGKDAMFKVKVDEVKESILPELDDEFAKDVSEFDTLEEYKASIKERLTKQKKEASEKAYKDAVMDKVIESIEGDIPHGMIEDRIDSTIQSYEYNLRAQGMDFASYLKMMGMNVADFRKTLEPSMDRQVKIDLALEKIAELENIEITAEDIEAEYKNVAEKYNIDVENAKKSLSEEAVKEQLKSVKAEDIIYSSATVEKKAAKKPTAEDSENE